MLFRSVVVTELLGYDDTVGRNIRALLLPDDPVSLFRSVMESGKPAQRITQLVHQNGQVNSYNLYAFRFTDANKHYIIYRLVEIAHEIKAHLQSAKELSYTLVENMPDAILFHNNGTIVHVNPAGVKLLKAASKDELVGTSALDLVHPDDLERVKERIRETLSNPNHVSPIIEEKLVARDGSIFYAEVSNASVTIDGTKLVLVMVRDITKEKHYKERLEELNRNLTEQVEQEVTKRREREQLLVQQAKLAALGEMIGAIAHQWRQPLNALSLNIQDTLDAYVYNELNESYLKQFVDRSMRQVEYMSATIDDFRNYFRTSKTKNRFSLHRMMEDALNILGAQLKHFGIKVHVDDHCGEARINGYENELKQVIISLLGNAKDAIEATKRHYGNIYITLSQEKGQAVIDIADDGSGIPAEIMDKVFNPYFTTKEQGKGTGVGLYMSKTIIEQNMHGQLLYLPEGEHATTFRIILPTD